MSHCYFCKYCKTLVMSITLKNGGYQTQYQIALVLNHLQLLCSATMFLYKPMHFSFIHLKYPLGSSPQDTPDCKPASYCSYLSLLNFLCYVCCFCHDNFSLTLGSYLDYYGSAWMIKGKSLAALDQWQRAKGRVIHNTDACEHMWMLSMVMGEDVVNDTQWKKQSTDQQAVRGLGKSVDIPDDFTIFMLLWTG